MSVEHKDLPDAQLHEPKGVSAASAGQVYVADGGGSGAWGTPPYRYPLQVRFADISTAGDVYLPVPVAGTIALIQSVIDGAITGADCVLTGYIGIVPITGGQITIANSGSAAGDIDSTTPSALNDVTVGDVINIKSDGASTNTVAAEIVIWIEVS
jgi:hypothetical protein